MKLVSKHIPSTLGLLAIACSIAAGASCAAAGADADAAKAAEMAKKLANPIGAMISVPFQSNFDYGAGPTGDGFQYKLNLQPIVPLTLNPD